MTNNRPQGHERKASGFASVGRRRGQGLGTGPVGNASRPSGGSSQGSGGGAPQPGGGPRRSSSGGERGALSSLMGGKSSLLIIAVVAVLLLGGGGLGGLFNCGGSGQGGSLLASALPALLSGGSSSGSSGGLNLGSLLGSGGGLSLLGGGSTAQTPSFTLPFSQASTEPAAPGDRQEVDRNVAAGTPAKRTEILGKGKDKVTLMIYMCGTDLESRSGMATNDLNEIKKASYGDNVNVIVYTGGCSAWRTQGISANTNQIWRVTPGRMEKLAEDGSKLMTDPNTLSGFIRFCEKNYPANRRFLILWDHGGGSVSGFGYDEKNRAAGSMSLPGIKKALDDGGVKFEIIGFDACLMATVETALMTAEYADYLIASEETEPGVGWYYTPWLNELGKNTSMSSLDLGKSICDSFVAACAQQARGQRTTLSVVDLAELKYTVPDSLTNFANSVTGMVKNNNYKKVSQARNGSREFAASSRIDQVDLVDLADRLGTDEAKDLVKVVQSAVKYNRSGSLTGANGLSIYFPYRQPAKAGKAAKSADDIGIDDSYGECIRAFAAVEQAGQGAMAYTQQQSYAGNAGGGSMTDLLGMLLGGRSMTDDEASATQYVGAYLTDNSLNVSDLTVREQNGKPVLTMSDEKWSLVTGIDLNLFYRDEEGGFIDLGLDDVFSWKDNNTLTCDDSGAWLTLNGQIAAYYREYSDGDTTYGYIPIYLNNERAELTVVREGDTYSVTGVRRVYKNNETDTVSKVDTEIGRDSTIDLICDYYDRDGKYIDSYKFADPITCSGIAELKIAEAFISDSQNLVFIYRLTDIYEQAWWTNVYTLN